MKYFIQIEEFLGETSFSLWREDEIECHKELDSKSIVTLMQHVKSRNISINDVMYPSPTSASGEFSDLNGYLLEGDFDTKGFNVLRGANRGEFILNPKKDTEDKTLLYIPEDKGYAYTQEFDYETILGEHG